METATAGASSQALGSPQFEAEDLYAAYAMVQHFNELPDKTKVLGVQAILAALSGVYAGAEAVAQAGAGAADDSLTHPGTAFVYFAVELIKVAVSGVAQSKVCERVLPQVIATADTLCASFTLTHTDFQIQDMVCWTSDWRSIPAGKCTTGPYHPCSNLAAWYNP